MKSIFSFILILGSFGFTYGQIDFTNFVDKQVNKKENPHRFRSHDCISGDCKNGLGVLEVEHSGHFIYIIGKFEKKKLQGEATILRLPRLSIYSFNLKKIHPIDELKKHFESEAINEKVYVYYQKYAIGVIEAFYGEFKENKLDSGLYTFNGRFEDVGENRIINVPLTHFYNVMDSKGKEFFTDNKKLIEYRFRGSFTPEYGREKLAYTLNTNDDYIEINTNWNHNVIIKKHHIPEFFEVTHYNAKSEIVKEVLTHHNAMGTIGWVKEFLPSYNVPLVSMVGHSGVVLLPETMENIGLLPKDGVPYKNGMFYGKMTNGKPDNYGVYIDEYVLYDGFFNDKGEFDGYGYLTQRKKYPEQIWLYYYPIESNIKKIIEEKDLAVFGYFIGVFKNGRFKQGEAGVHDGNSDGLKLIKGDVFDKTEQIKLFSMNNYLLEGEGIKFKPGYINYMIPDQTNMGMKIEEQGSFANNLLHGKGYRNGDYGEFVNGEMTEESKKLAAEVNAQKRKEEIASTLSNAILPLGSIVKNQYGSYQYVNELYTTGSVDLINIPLEVPEYRKKDKSMDKYGIIYESSAYPLHAKPNYSILYYTGSKATQNELTKYTLTNLKICTQCRGRGSFLVKKESAGMSTNTTTTYERTYEGVFYDAYGNVTRTTNTPTTIIEWVKENCQTCNGAGCN